MNKPPIKVINFEVNPFSLPILSYTGNLNPFTCLSLDSPTCSKSYKFVTTFLSRCNRWNSRSSSITSLKQERHNLSKSNLTRTRTKPHLAKKEKSTNIDHRKIGVRTLLSSSPKIKSKYSMVKWSGEEKGETSFSCKLKGEREEREWAFSKWVGGKELDEGFNVVEKWNH